MIAGMMTTPTPMHNKAGEAQLTDDAEHPDGEATLATGHDTSAAPASNTAASAPRDGAREGLCFNERPQASQRNKDTSGSDKSTPLGGSTTCVMTSSTAEGGSGLEVEEHPDRSGMKCAGHASKASPLANATPCLTTSTSGSDRSTQLGDGTKYVTMSSIANRGSGLEVEQHSGRRGLKCVGRASKAFLRDNKNPGMTLDMAEATTACGGNEHLSGEDKLRAVGAAPATLTGTTDAIPGANPGTGPHPNKNRHPVERKMPTGVGTQGSAGRAPSPENASNPDGRNNTGFGHTAPAQSVPTKHPNKTSVTVNDGMYCMDKDSHGSNGDEGNDKGGSTHAT